MIGWIALVAALVLNAGANSLLKVGASSLEGGLSSGTLVAAATNIYLIGGIALFALNILCYTFALSRLPLSVAYPVMVIGGLLIITSFSVLVFHESLSYLQIGGLALVLLGVVLFYI